MLIGTALIEPVEDGAPGDAIIIDHIGGSGEIPSGLVRRIEEIHAGLQDINYYDLFGIGQSAGDDEIRRVFYRTAREFHPDRHFYLAEDLKEKLHEIFSCCVRAYAVLSSPEKRSEYDSSVAGIVPGVSRVLQAKGRFDEGVSHFNAGHFDRAAACFEEAVHLDNREARYHFFSARALIELGRVKEAERAFSRACTISPDCDEYHAERGHIYLKLGSHRKARMSFIKALRNNVSNKRAQEGLLSL